MRFPCTILNGEVIPREHVIQETLLDHWYLKDQIAKGRVEVIGAKSDPPPAGTMTIEDLTKAQLVEGIRQAQPEFDPGRMTKAQLVEVFMEVAVPKISTENGADDNPVSTTESGDQAGSPEGSQENQE